MKTVSEQDMRRLCQLVDEFLPPGHGFIVFAFPRGNAPDRQLRYASNSNRDDCVNALKEWMIMRGLDEEWMRHGDD